MNELYKTNPEKIYRSVSLEPVDMHQLSGLIHESEDAFLPSASHPEQTTTQLFEIFKDMTGFQPYGYKIAGRLISYIIALGHRDPSIISIGPMYVAERHRGHGLGMKQVEDFVAQAKTNGHAAVYTKTWSENTPSRKIFESLGFENIGIKHSDRANGDSTIEYLRQL